MIDSMKTVKIIRLNKSSTEIRGVMITPTQVLFTLERPWLNNARNISCIPKGKYKVKYLPKSYSGKYKKIFHVLKVPGRSGILIHNGNLVTHTKGCILLGTRPGRLANRRAVLNSRTAMRKLVKELKNQTFTLEIV